MLQITMAARADAASILDLQKQAYASEARLYGDWTIPPLTQTLESLTTEITSGIVLKAQEAGVLVGSVRGSLKEGVCHIGRLIVAPACQGRGIGTALLQALEAEFPGAHAFELFTGNRSEGNIRLYTRHGYVQIGTRRLSDAVTLVVLSKENGRRA